MVASPRNVQSDRIGLARPGPGKQAGKSWEAGGKKLGSRREPEGLGTNGGCVSRQERSGLTAPIRTRTPKYKKTPERVEKTVDELAQARIRQYRLQEVAGDILPGERGLNACMRC